MQISKKHTLPHDVISPRTYTSDPHTLARAVFEPLINYYTPADRIYITLQIRQNEYTMAGFARARASYARGCEEEKRAAAALPGSSSSARACAYIGGRRDVALVIPAPRAARGPHARDDIYSLRILVYFSTLLLEQCRRESERGEKRYRV